MTKEHTTGKWTRVVLKCVVIGLIMLVLLEVGVRILGLAPPLPKVFQDEVYVPDPHLPYHQAPSITRSVTSRTGEFVEEFTHNSRGFRDLEHPFEKPAGTVRILGVGDSFTRGSAAKFEDTYLATLERLLNEATDNNPRIEIIKAGIGGFFPEPERLLVEHYGMAYDPDLLVVGFNETDLLETYIGTEEVRLAEGLLKTRQMRELGVIRAFLVLKTHLGRILFRAAGRERRERLERGAEEHLERTWKQIESEYDGMWELIKARGGQMIVCHIPVGLPPPPDHLVRLEAYGKRAGVRIVDATPYLERAARKGPVYWEKDGHCTARGYRAVAEALFDVMLDERLLEVGE